MKPLIAIGVVVFICFVFYLQVSLWQECRVTNSWMYCMHVLSK